MPCQPCQASRGAPTHASHSLGCVYCGARSIQKIQRYPLQQAEIVARCRRVLALWVAQGHAEAEIRRLAKGSSLCLEPMDSQTATGGRNKK